jgi:cobalt-zinc-cadmium efflux system membrane fusion protein
MKRLLMLGLLTLSALASAGPGHDHGEAAAPATPGGPQRQADGSVFLPKPAQRQLGLRTQPVQAAELPRAFTLQGRVVMDPNAGGKVQALQAGRVALPPAGLPQLGQRVQRGQLLAYLEPASAALERSAQSAQVAELRAAQELAEKQLARLQELADTVPRRDIEAAQSAVQSLKARVAALSQGLGGREALRAPVSGVIASSNAVAGQVVDARELLFEIVDPARLRIEALAYEPALAADLGAAFLEGAGQPQPLKFLGSGSALREQALPLNFAAQGALNLALGQPVKVVVQSRSTVTGFAVPAAALMKNPANQTIVWVKAAPERFVPKVVQAQALDGVRVAVIQGLEAGDKVVTTGANLVNQVR